MAYLFLSYAKADRETALAIRDVLRKEGFQVWVDENVHDPSFLYRWQLQKTIRHAWGFVLLVSDAAKESRSLKRELNYAQKIRKPIFPIVIQGECWEGLETEITSFGLGLELDISDADVKKLSDKMPLTDELKVPSQLPSINGIGMIRYFLNWAVIIGIVLLVVLRLVPFTQNYFQEAAMEATASILTATALHITPSPDPLILTESAATDIAAATATNEALFDTFETQLAPVNATETHEANMDLTAVAGNGILPCPVTIRVNELGELETYNRPSTDNSSFDPSPIYSYDRAFVATEWIVNDDGVWYRVKRAGAWGILGYVLVENLILDDNCPR